MKTKSKILTRANSSNKNCCAVIYELLIVGTSGLFLFLILSQLSCNLKQHDRQTTRLNPCSSRAIVNFPPYSSNLDNLKNLLSYETIPLQKPQLDQYTTNQQMSAAVAEPIIANYLDKLDGTDIFLIMLLWIDGIFFTKFATSLAERLKMHIQESS